MKLGKILRLVSFAFPYLYDNIPLFYRVSTCQTSLVYYAGVKFNVSDMPFVILIGLSALADFCVCWRGLHSQWSHYCSLPAHCTGTIYRIPLCLTPTWTASTWKFWLYRCLNTHLYINPKHLHLLNSLLGTPTPVPTLVYSYQMR